METPRRRALGKGLNELFSTEILDFDSLEEKIITETPKEEIVELNLEDLRSNPYQPRVVFDEKALEELAASIKEHGVFQPIIVKKSIHGYEIIAGERRVKASRMAGLDTVPAIIREFDDTEMMEIALLENLQREDLNPFEEANAYVKIMEAKNLTHDELAKVLGKSQSYVTNTIGLLRLPDNIKELVINGSLSMTHARILSKMSDRNTINLLAEKIIKENLSVRDLEEIAKGNNINKIVKVKRKVKESDREYKYAEELLCEKLDSKVRVYKNKIEVKFSNTEDLNRILEILNIGK
jgi:ParB family chromosome partitioning protein